MAPHWYDMLTNWNLKKVDGFKYPQLVYDYPDNNPSSISANDNEGLPGIGDLLIGKQTNKSIQILGVAAIAMGLIYIVNK